MFCKEHGIPWKVHQQLGDLKRLDFVFYTYKTDSIKGQKREGRGIGVTLTARMETSIVKKFQVFLKNSDNKTELLKMLAINITKIPASIVEIMATHLEEVISKNLDADLSALQPCNHEEAGTRLLLQALNASKSGFKRLLIVTVDTDVVVLVLCHFFTLISRTCGSRSVPERIGDGFPFIYMRKHGNRRCAKHCTFDSL